MYLQEQASPRRTAQRLDVHEDTVKNRVRTTAADETHCCLARRPRTLAG